MNRDFNGTSDSGFYRVTVHGSQRVDLEFVRSAARGNGEVAFRFSLLPDGSS